MKSYIFLIKLAIAVVLAIVAYFVLAHFKILPSITDMFKSKEVVIDETPVVIKNIKSIAQLMSLEKYDEVVVQINKTEVNSPSLMSILVPMSFTKDNNLTLIVRGRLVAGIDLSKLDTTKIFVQKDSISLQLPPTAILDSIINPSDVQVFTEKGNWTPEDVLKLKKQAIEKMILKSAKEGFIQKADDRSRLLMRNFLRSLGFKKITLT